MLDLALDKRRAAFRISVKATVSVLLIVLAVGLPQLTHALGGAQAGGIYMPMYLPALLAGLVLGKWWGLGVGVLAPIASWAFTTLAFGSAMPALDKLPYMILETAIYGFVTGLFSKKLADSPLFAFPAVLGAQFIGRCAYLVYNLIAGRAFADLWSGMLTAMPGLWLQAVIAPAAAIIICMVIKHEQKTA